MDRRQKIAGYIGAEPGIRLTLSDFLMDILNSYKRPLNFDEIRERNLQQDRKAALSNQTLKLLSDEAESKNIALCLPIIRKESLIGIWILGNKLAQDMFNAVDMRWFAVLSFQMAVAIENVTLLEHEKLMLFKYQKIKSAVNV